MKVQIATNNTIVINGQWTHLGAVQEQNGTTIYTRQDKLTGRTYQVHTMPKSRYQLSSSEGLAELGEDLKTTGLI